MKNPLLQNKGFQIDQLVQSSQWRPPPFGEVRGQRSGGGRPGLFFC
jgi:hypothetical protein